MMFGQLVCKPNGFDSFSDFRVSKTPFPGISRHSHQPAPQALKMHMYDNSVYLRTAHYNTRLVLIIPNMDTCSLILRLRPSRWDQSSRRPPLHHSPVPFRRS